MPESEAHTGRAAGGGGAAEMRRGASGGGGMQAAACLVVVLRRLHPLPPAAAILHLAARLGAALRLAVGEPQQPHRRPPAPILEEIGGQHRRDCGGVGVAVDVGPPPTALGLLALARRRQVWEGSGGTPNVRSQRRPERGPSGVV